MTTYHDVVLDHRKARIPSETHQGEEWFDLKRVFIAIGYASYTTHQETALRESQIRLYVKRKRVYANISGLEYLRDNIAMSRKRKSNLVKLLFILKRPTTLVQMLELWEEDSAEEIKPEPQQPHSPVLSSVERLEQIRNGSPIRIYIAGRMNYSEYSPLEYGLAPEGRALLNIYLRKSNGKDNGENYKLGAPEPFFFDGRAYEYTGPFFLGDNHGCMNTIKNHGVDEYGWDEGGEGVNAQTVVDTCKKQIAKADLVFAWLGSDSDQAHGTLVEIGYAAGTGTKVYVASTPEDSKETWFAKHIAYKWFVCPNFMSAFQEVTSAYLREFYEAESTRELYELPVKIRLTHYGKARLGEDE